jgi:hypothetical protein
MHRSCARYSLNATVTFVTESASLAKLHNIFSSFLDGFCIAIFF